MNVPPRVPLALTPTPILKLDRLSRELGVELFIKRDDLTGLLESGNKVRKLEFLVGEALAENADTLITCGTLQSNCCRAVAAVAARLGLRAVLAVKGERPATYEGNLLLGRLLGAEIRYLSDDEFACADDTLDRVAAEIRERGGRPYVIPESGSNAVGALGYLECAVELAEQINHGAPRFDAVVISVYSGGSQAGLLMGKQLAGLPAEIVGVPIARPADMVREHVTQTIGQAMRRFGFAIDVPKSIHLLDGYQGVGRASVGEAELAGIVALARSEGVVLDPVYTAKAFGGLVDTLRRDPKALGHRVCFIHTGGIFSLFAHSPQLSGLLDR
jgi:D-cysteine desulfhydrase family pyridoxal phosphate-dependent enzyme